MPKLLVSACLLATPCRYDGDISGDLRHKLERAGFTLIPFCPECAGGLLTPRLPAEITAGTGLSINDGVGAVTRQDGEDVTEAFRRGAELALRLCEAQGITVALLKAKSPSCGVGARYDGRFSRALIEDDGVTAARLRQAGITLFTEKTLDTLLHTQFQS